MVYVACPARQEKAVYKASANGCVLVEKRCVEKLVATCKVTHPIAGHAASPATRANLASVAHVNSFVLAHKRLVVESVSTCRATRPIAGHVGLFVRAGSSARLEHVRESVLPGSCCVMEAVLRWQNPLTIVARVAQSVLMNNFASMARVCRLVKTKRETKGSAMGHVSISRQISRTVDSVAMPARLAKSAKMAPVSAKA